MDAIVFHPIGILHTPFEDTAQTPIQSSRSNVPGEVEVYPCCPNPLGFSVVRLERRECRRLLIRRVDMLDGTPLLDIKPYNPEFDIHPAQCTGWYEHRAHP